MIHLHDNWAISLAHDGVDRWLKVHQRRKELFLPAAVSKVNEESSSSALLKFSDT